ncbi:hypothetical protein [Neobacillus rhizophilus]|nr:hypothetical protein [Neobacillus rhizophilus]
MIKALGTTIKYGVDRELDKETRKFLESNKGVFLHKTKINNNTK